MTLVALTRYAISTLIRMAQAGELAPSHLWVALRGAAKYVAAVRAGDVADDATQQARAATCNGCRSARVRETETEAVAVHCGVPFDEGRDTCGCLVAIRVEGVVYPAAKTVVGSERCLQGKW